MIQKMKIAPHLFVGLGGCGSQIVNEIARKVKRKQDEYERYKNLIHFFAFDTDQHELKQADAVDVRVPISDFDKRSFVAHSFGQRGSPEDPLFSSWWPEYYMPRDVAGAGAGQIRIESRLSAYFTLKFKPDLFTALERTIGQSFGISERFRDQDKFPMVHIYASLAGGTGSGSFLPLAYLLYDLFKEHRRPIVIGTFVMPAVFRRAGLPAQQLDKIMANGYAALMELEHLQAATSEEPIEFQYDPRAKEKQNATRRAFDQVYLVDDIGALREVITDPRQVYYAIADSAYAQIFSDILGRQSSTADNDEREMGVTDVQRYTKRYGSFGLSVLSLPDEDILDYCAHRFAAEALTRTFALPEEIGQLATTDEHADRERRDQEFVRSLISQAGLPGESGAFYKRIVDGCDGSELVQGAVDRFLRSFETSFVPRFSKHAAALPRLSEDKLLEWDEAPDLVRTELPRFLDAFKKFSRDARDKIDQEASFIAEEVAGSVHEHSFGKLVGEQGPIFERLFLVRVAGRLREMQAAARTREQTAQAKLAGLDQGFARWLERLSEAAPKTLTEYLRGNDYGREVVPEFIGWYRANLEGPQLSLLEASGTVDLCEDLVREVESRKDRLGTLFAELVDIRGKAAGVAEELRTFGVRRELGGQSNEHVLDVEVYQNFEDPKKFRIWHWVFERRENVASDYDPTKIFPAIQKAYAGVKHARHMSEAVIESLVAMGRGVWRERIVGKDEPRGLEDMGLSLAAGFAEEARLSLAWARLRKHHPNEQARKIKEFAHEWELALEAVTQAEIDDYVSHKIQHAARKCAPFLRLNREERATSIEPKRYVLVYRPYLDDPRLRAALVENERFPVKGSDVLHSEDPKRAVFYWSELGMPLYRVESMDDYYDRYHHVKRDELGRGKVYRWQDLAYHPKQGASVEHGEGRKVPDIPLHIDKRWEGAPDEYACLADVAPKAVYSGQGKIAWLEKRDRVQTHRAAEELVNFVMAQCYELLLVREPDGQFVFANDDIPERDRTLGKFRDAAFAKFRDSKLAIREWLLHEIEAKNQRLIENRDRDGVKQIVGARIEELKKLRLQLEGKEQTFVEQELKAAEQAIEALLGKM
jgi:hypothetical protein